MTVPFTDPPLSQILQRKIGVLERAVANHRAHVRQLEPHITDMDDLIHGYELANETLWNTVLRDDS